MWWKKKFRGVLKQHLDAQHVRGQGNPSERPAPRPRYRSKGRPKEYHDDAPSVTLAEHWPEVKP
ncbi:hypothetical protein LCGC14_0391310 [marine sediment metagenome]|uniref:Uncharacterized protein n=1 Tax=marine sediment metagenome TaxID=412755 RepID=A0A0F9SZK0_9ZZZZ